MLGYVDTGSAIVWLEVDTTVKNIKLMLYNSADSSLAGKYEHVFGPGLDQHIAHMAMHDLLAGQTYYYQVYLNDSVYDKFHYPLMLHTRAAQVDAFSFLFGSCAYVNDPEYDDTTDAYGQNPGIFDVMAGKIADFMIWGGDYAYLRDDEWKTTKGMMHRYQRNRSLPQAQALLAAMPNLAIWDDHDYGENDSDGRNPSRKDAVAVFKAYWANPSYGSEEAPGIWTTFNFGNAAFYFLDDRFYRSPNDMDDDSPDKSYYGTMQLHWLKQKLTDPNNKAAVKFIVTGNQVLNPVNEFECYTHYKKEWENFMQFLVDNKVSGVVFLTGDRHFSEVNTYKPDGFYTLYDITCSPLTSKPFTGITEYKEYDNPARVPGSLILEQNFMRISVDSANISIDTKRQNGYSVWNYQIPISSLQVPAAN